MNESWCLIGLFGFSPSLVVIFAALSPHPKIPFLADKYRDGSGDFGTGIAVVLDLMEPVRVGCGTLVARVGMLGWKRWLVRGTLFYDQ